jgi:hypothetical protein
MRKLSRILAIVTIALTPLMASGTAFAATTCPIGFTGPNSSNICTSETSYTCTVNNNTNVATVMNNDQTAVSGIGLNTQNTQSGSTSSGSATNSNGVTFDVSVINNVDTAGVCTVAATIPAVITAEPVVQAAATQVNRPAVLADTSSDTTTGYLIAIASILGIGAITFSLATYIYNHQHSK